MRDFKVTIFFAVITFWVSPAIFSEELKYLRDLEHILERATSETLRRLKKSCKGQKISPMLKSLGEHSKSDWERDKSKTKEIGRQGVPRLDLSRVKNLKTVPLDEELFFCLINTISSVYPKTLKAIELKTKNKKYHIADRAFRDYLLSAESLNVIPIMRDPGISTWNRLREAHPTKPLKIKSKTNTDGKFFAGFIPLNPFLSKNNQGIKEIMRQDHFEIPKRKALLKYPTNVHDFTDFVTSPTFQNEQSEKSPFKLIKGSEDGIKNQIEELFKLRMQLQKNEDLVNDPKNSWGKMVPISGGKSLYINRKTGEEVFTTKKELGNKINRYESVSVFSDELRLINKPKKKIISPITGDYDCTEFLSVDSSSARASSGRGIFTSTTDLTIRVINGIYRHLFAVEKQYSNLSLINHGCDIHLRFDRLKPTDYPQIAYVRLSDTVLKLKIDAWHPSETDDQGKTEEDPGVIFRIIYRILELKVRGVPSSEEFQVN